MRQCDFSATDFQIIHQFLLKLLDCIWFMMHIQWFSNHIPTFSVRMFIDSLDILYCLSLFFAFCLTIELFSIHNLIVCNSFEKTSRFFLSQKFTRFIFFILQIHNNFYTFFHFIHISINCNDIFLLKWTEKQIHKLTSSWHQK